MYSTLSVRDFRGIRSLDGRGFRRLNLVLGRNNSGKSSVLESLFLLGGATAPALPTSLGRIRGQKLGHAYPDAVWRPLFHNLDPKRTVEIRGRWADEPSERRLEIEALGVTTYADISDSATGSEGGIAVATQDFVIGGMQLRYRSASESEILTHAIFDPRSRRIEATSKDREDFIRTTFLSARAYSSLERDAEQFSFLLKIKQEQDVIDALRIIEPTVQRIEVVSEPSGPSVYLDVGLDSLVPLAVGGDGMVRLFSIIVELTASRGGVLLIDEIDNGLHYSVMPTLWGLLRTLAERHRVQIFATTHNDDIIRSALEAFVETEGTLGLFRIDKREHQHVMVSYSDEAMKGVLEDNFEVRG